MKKILLSLGLVTPFMFGVSAQTAAPTTAPAHHDAHWDYEGQHGPEHWAELDPAYALCDKGTAQSPVDITKVGEGSNTWKVNYGTTSLEIFQQEYVSDLLDNGHTIEVKVEKGSTLTTARNVYHLKQFHFHTPSEHTFDGNHLPMEVHFVHQSTNGQLAVVGVLFREGPPNENLAKLISNFPTAKGQAAVLPTEKLNLMLQLPPRRAAYSYIGSLTTPPCTENVEWFVLRDTISASREQLDAFTARLKANNRPIQPLNDRSIQATAPVSSIKE